MIGMLYLTKSKVRGKLLGVLFSSASSKHYLSELARLVGTSAGNVQRELSGFVKDRLVRCEKTGNMVFYSLNPQHPFFGELKSLVSKTWGVEGSLRDLVEKTDGIRLALLYGSFAKGSEHGQSDIDLLIVSDQGTSDFYSRLNRLESLFDREINPTVYSSGDLKKRIQEKSVFIEQILKGQHRVLKGDLKEWMGENTKRIRRKR